MDEYQVGETGPELLIPGGGSIPLTPAIVAWVDRVRGQVR